MGLIGHHGLLKSEVIMFNDNYALSNGFSTDPDDPNYTGNTVKKLTINPLLYDWSGDFTIEFKFKSNHFLKGFPTLFLLSNGSEFCRIFMGSATKLRLQSRVSGVIGNDIQLNVALGHENHLIFSFKRDEIVRLCLSGLLSNTTTNVLCPTTVVNAGFLGCGQDVNNSCLNGYQYDCRIYIGKAANETEMTDMYNGGVRRDATPAMLPYLMTDYRLNQVNGNLAIDRGPLENHGQLINYIESETQAGAGYWIAR